MAFTIGMKLAVLGLQWRVTQEAPPKIIPRPVLELCPINSHHNEWKNHAIFEYMERPD
jgi:hypothetical protein